MNRTERRSSWWAVMVVAAAAVGTASAQHSASFQLEEHTLNGGGSPRAGTVLASTSFRITLASLGESLIAPPLGSASFRMEGGFGSAYAPPGEVQGLHFTDATTLLWSPEPSRRDYALYEGALSVPFDPGYGLCEEPPPSLTSETATVADTPAGGQALFFLVTARNRLGEEGPKGFDTTGTERGNPIPCP